MGISALISGSPGWDKMPPPPPRAQGLLRQHLWLISKLITGLYKDILTALSFYPRINN